MLELFDMGKYNFYVWASIAVFVVALLADYLSASSQHKNIKKQVKAQNRQVNARRNKS